jgi:hypothetical protein
VQYAAGNDVTVEDRNDAHRLIMSDMKSLIEHVQASLRMIESAIVRETSLGNEETSANVIVPDDITPRYTKADAALRACDAGLGAALEFLLDSAAAERGLN